MNIKEQNRRMLNVLRWVSKFNIGDEYESRIRRTLIDIGKCAHQFSPANREALRRYRLPSKCIFCDKTRKQVRNSK